MAAGKRKLLKQVVGALLQLVGVPALVLLGLVVLLGGHVILTLPAGQLLIVGASCAALLGWWLSREFKR